MERKKVPTKKGTRSTKAVSSRKSTAQPNTPSTIWSGKTILNDPAMDPEEYICNRGSAEAIAEMLKRFAQKNKSKKSDAFQSAMSLLNFYINRAGKNLPENRKQILESAEEKLRHFFSRPDIRKI